VHLKDYAETVGARLRAGALELVPAVKEGLFRPLGDGDAPVDATVLALESSGYGGWYVLEQDVSVRSEDPGSGPAENVQRSLDHLLAVLSGPAASG
jgi:inosose dehydratase